MAMTTFRRLMIFAGMALLLGWPSLVQACEGCKSSAQSGGAPNAIGQAFGLSIYFLLAVPTLLMFGLVRLMIRQCRALDEQHARVLAPAGSVARPRATHGLEGLGEPIPVR
jgi:hypothetical protein